MTRHPITDGLVKLSLESASTISICREVAGLRLRFTGALLLLLAGGSHAVKAQQIPTVFKGLDLYRSSQISEAEVEKAFQSDIEQVVDLMSVAMSVGDMEAVEEPYTAVVNGIRAMGDFAFANLGIITYFEEGENVVYVTVDVVDRADSIARMGFDAQPTGSVEDPLDVLAAWDEYLQKGFQLLQSRELGSESASCPVHHCFAGFEHPELEGYKGLFDRAAREHKTQLVRVLREEADASQRAAAAFVLAHMQDAGELVEILMPSVQDPSSSVRNSALRVLAFIANGQDSVPIPVEPVLRALDYPEGSDRNKAAWLLAGLAGRPEYREAILSAAPVLLRLLRLEQPNNHLPAYGILQELSGKDFGERDYDSWEAWVEEQVSKRRGA